MVKKLSLKELEETEKLVQEIGRKKAGEVLNLRPNSISNRLQTL